ncbi:MAG TPA: hypothetical protein VFI90_10210 [Rubrobacter sp.]|nr:hypothetical protein [Rubrobacter sp.]
MAEEQTPTYYPGDKMVMEIEHQPNFRTIQAVFGQRPDREDVVPLKASMSTGVLLVKETGADGRKVSVARFEKSATREDWVPGVYELTELHAETVGALPGESKHGRIIMFDVSDIDRPRLRCEEEAEPFYVVVRRAELR